MPSHMLPWGHAAVGYLLLSGTDRIRGTRPTVATTVTVGIGSQLPDLIDKPLAWTVPILPNGRSLAHSLVSGSLILLVLAGVLAVAGLGRLAWPLAIGALSHSVADALLPLFTGEHASLAFLVWPVLPAVQFDGAKSILAHLLGIDPLAPWVLLQTGLVVAAVVVWGADGAPGVHRVQDGIRSAGLPGSSE